MSEYLISGRNGRSGCFLYICVAKEDEKRWRTELWRGESDKREMIVGQLVESFSRNGQRNEYSL